MIEPGCPTFWGNVLCIKILLVTDKAVIYNENYGRHCFIKSPVLQAHPSHGLRMLVRADSELAEGHLT